MRHIAAIHEKRKDVKCPQCNKCFSRKDYLKLHIQKCHWNKCPNCKESFESEDVFDVHVVQCTGSPMAASAGTSSTRSTPRAPPTKRKAARAARLLCPQLKDLHSSPQINYMLTPARKSPAHPCTSISSYQ